MNFQARYAQRWGHLHNPHVRALAWLIDAPDLLDAAAPEWAGRLAAPMVVTPAITHWLAQLDTAPAPLLAALAERPRQRLGLYAEQLMAFFYAAQQRLVAHGVQVRASRNDTVGEFDFLLEMEDVDSSAGLEHIELATKFYLLETDKQVASRFDTLIGPNLADSLGAKMRKIIDRQLTLGDHPAAQALLARPVLQARALVKGWLFYPPPMVKLPGMDGIHAAHCRGFWCAHADLHTLPEFATMRWVLLPRLQWLAPYRLQAGTETLDGAGLVAALAGLFAVSPAPVLVAALQASASGAIVEMVEVVEMVEAERGFIVPDDWQARAAARHA